MRRPGVRAEVQRMSAGAVPDSLPCPSELVSCVERTKNERKVNYGRKCPQD